MELQTVLLARAGLEEADMEAQQDKVSWAELRSQMASELREDTLRRSARAPSPSTEVMPPHPVYKWLLEFFKLDSPTAVVEGKTAVHHMCEFASAPHNRADMPDLLESLIADVPTSALSQPIGPESHMEGWCPLHI